jgi:hypothetical protein
MLDVRSLVLICVLFAGAFYGARWIRDGMPAPQARVAAPPAEPRMRTIDEIRSKNSADTLRQDWLAWTEQVRRDAYTAQSDGDPERDKLRTAVIETATAFAGSSCNAAFKEQYLQAAAAYARAFATLAECPKYPACTGDDALTERAERLFASPADGRVREAIRAVHAMGLSLKEYPGGIGWAVAHLAKSGNWTDAEFSCASPQASLAKRNPPTPGPAPPPPRFNPSRAR